MKKKQDINLRAEVESELKVNKKRLIKASRPGGFLDFLPKEYLAQESMLEIISKTFRSFGFDSMDTSIVE